MTKHLIETDGARLTLWEDGPDWDGETSATLGAFTCQSAEAGAEVPSRAVATATDRGLTRILAPMDGDTWHSYRFVTESDGSPAFLMEPPDKPLARAALEAAGFDVVSHYFSARVALPQTGHTAPDPTEAFETTPWDGNDPEALFAEVHALSTQAFAQNAFYKPISREDFLAMYVPIVPLLKRELIFFARRTDGSLAGFLFGVPNYAEGPTPKAAILKTYASLEKGAGRHLSHAFHSAAAEMGFETAIHALIHDDNLSAERSAAEGGHVFRRYGLYGLSLDG